MSDDGDDFMQDSDNEQYDFEFEDDDGNDGDGDGEVDLDNEYYGAKAMKEESPVQAIEMFLKIPSQEEEKGEWGFKALKQAIKLEYQLRQYDKAIEHYKEVLTYTKSAVTRNRAEKSINNMLDFVEKGSEDSSAFECMEKFYSLTLESFQNTNNERLWLKTNIKLARLWLERGQYALLVKKVRELHKACQLEDGSDDPNKGTYSMEIYALEIQMYAETRNNKRLKALYQKALRVRSAVTHPKIMGVIRECGGKMHMSEENWKEAQSDFFESFKNYDEAGSLQRITVLKYLVLTTMLMSSDINPFESQETKPYKNDPRVSAMVELVDAYQLDDILRYEAVLQNNKDLIKDPFIAENIDEVTRNMRTKAVIKCIAPYRRFSMSIVAKRLQLSVAEVEDIVGFLIVDKKLNARINQELGTVELDIDTDGERTRAMQAWVKSVNSLWTRTLTEAEGFKIDDMAGDTRSQFKHQMPPLDLISNWGSGRGGMGGMGGKKRGSSGFYRGNNYMAHRRGNMV